MGNIPLLTSALRPRLPSLRWTLPLILGFFAVLYEVGSGSLDSR